MPSAGQSQATPTRGSSFWKRVLSLFGWSLAYRHPEFERYVLVVAPHTSNWDFLLGVAAKWALGLDVRYLAKDSLFNSPLGWFFRKIGGIPVHRDSSNDMSQQMAKIFSQSDALVLALAPEGTRSATDHWKSGFWHIAKAARVPIAMAYIDYSKKQIGGGEYFTPGDDIDADFERIDAFYSTKRGRNPEQESSVKQRSGR